MCIRRTRNIVVNPANLGFEFQGPRYKHFGPSSGEAFVDDFLVDIISRNYEEGGKFKITIDFSGTKTFSPSFIDEIFSRLVYYGYTKVVKNMKTIGGKNVYDEWLDFFYDRKRVNLNEI
jgi:hypothetical protein